jgi:hypothetical protein
MIRHALRAARALIVVALFAGASCSRNIPLGSDQTSGGVGGVHTTGGAGGYSATGGTSGTVATGGTISVGGSSGAEAGAAGDSDGKCVKATCYGKVYECGDCIDNDGDGKVDAEDPECTGPCDDREDSFDVGLPGSSSDKCSQDCFFDNGNGAGNDGCRYSHQCDPLSVAPDYPPTGSAACAYDPNAKIPGGGTCADLSEQQAASCSTVCGPLTPNGCDCFGCCEIPPGSFHYVGLGYGSGSSPCNSENLDDPVACPPCTQVKSCLNTCDPCESCVGRPEPLASCTDSSAACASLYPPCNTSGGMLCPEGSYCITGCCIPEPR